MLRSLPIPSRALPINRRSELTSWLARARPGDRVVYHQGFLVVDYGPTSSLQDRERHRLDAVATAVRDAAVAGAVHLVQERLGTNTFGYLAVRAVRRPRPDDLPDTSPVPTRQHVRWRGTPSSRAHAQGSGAERVP